MAHKRIQRLLPRPQKLDFITPISVGVPFTITLASVARKAAS
jgi:hypothetical protein